MTFTTPCFVRVEDAAEREKLIEWLKGIGYSHLPFIYQSLFIATDIHGMIWITDANRGGAHDCGANIELFKSLAAMNNDNDIEQWFIDKNGFMMKGNRGLDVYTFNKCFRKATSDEIIKYFTNATSRS